VPEVAQVKEEMLPMTDFIWIVGPSAIGKQTFITKVMGDAGCLRRELGLSTEAASVVARGRGWDLKDAEFCGRRLLEFPSVRQARHVLVKHQNEFDQAERLSNQALGSIGRYAAIVDLAESTRADGGRHQVMLLRVAPPLHAARWREKYFHRPTPPDPAIADALRRNDVKRAGELLAHAWKGYRDAVLHAAAEAESRGLHLETQILDDASDCYTLRSVAVSE